MSPVTTNLRTYDMADVHVFESRKEMAIAAAENAARLINEAILERGTSRIMIATGNSQLDLVEELVKRDINWKSVHVFHMDEYVGINADHPASFRRWIRGHVEDQIHPATVNYIEGDAADVDSEIARYSRLLLAGSLDVAFVGFGENGHIAFNDPPSADFSDPQTVKRVTLESDCRYQQVGEGHFENFAMVPTEAITVSCAGLFRASAWISCVPERRKAMAVSRALTGPISTACPASIVRNHKNATVYLDRESASLL